MVPPASGAVGVTREVRSRAFGSIRVSTAVAVSSFIVDAGTTRASGLRSNTTWAPSITMRHDDGEVCAHVAARLATRPGGTAAVEVVEGGRNVTGEVVEVVVDVRTGAVGRGVGDVGD